MNKFIDNNQNQILVENYGQAGYNPIQETLLFLELLKLGHRPSLVIFMDGINLGPQYDGSEFTINIAKKFEYNGLEIGDLKLYLNKLPIINFLSPQQQIDYLNSDDFFYSMYGLLFQKDEKGIDIYTNRLTYNFDLRKKIAELYDVKIINILQPNVFIDYDTAYLSDFTKDYAPEIVKNNYKGIYKKTLELNDDLIYFDGLFQEFNKPAIIDIMHYSPSFNKLLAEKVYEEIKIDELKDYLLKADEIQAILFNLEDYKK